MLVEYRNEIYRRKEKSLSISFCENRCPLRNFGNEHCYLGNIPYICPVIGDIHYSTSEIFDL